MDIISIVKLFGSGIVKRALAHALRRRATTAGYAALATALTAAVAGCGKQDADATAQGLTDALFAIT